MTTDGANLTSLSIVLFVAAWVAGAVTRSGAASMLAVAVGYLAVARLGRSWPIAAVSVALGAGAAFVAIADPPHGDFAPSFAFGLSFTVTGLLLRRRDPVH